MPAKAVAAATPTSDAVRVKVRHKGAGLISKGERHERSHMDLHYAAGDVFETTPEIANVLLERDLVDPAD